MRKLIVLLCSSFMLCLAVITSAHASPPAPDRKVHPTEYAMRPAVATCVPDTVATTHVAILKPTLGPVAPDSLVAVDGGAEYLALLRSMTCPPDCRPKRANDAGRTGAGPPQPEKEVVYEPAHWLVLLPIISLQLFIEKNQLGFY